MNHTHIIPPYLHSHFHSVCQNPNAVKRVFVFHNVYTALALKGEDVRFELLYVGKCWFALMMNKRKRREEEGIKGRKIHY